MMKVFGIGAPRTGNTSLEYILRAARLRVLPAKYGVDRVEDCVNGEHEATYMLVDDYEGFTGAPYEGFTGAPWNIGQFYRVLAHRHPDAKFVMTVRPAKPWVQSLRRCEITHDGIDDASAIQIYRQRCLDAEHFFAGTDRLFRLDWRTFRWGPFCDFLGVPHIPHDTQVPHMRRWEQQPHGKFGYAANPVVDYGPQPTDEPRATIHFTVSMWNRAEHLRKQLQNFQLLANVDHKIAVHVAYFDSDDIGPDEARDLIEEGLTCPSRMVHLPAPFNNGYGHNMAASGIPSYDIVCPVTVDLKMPLDICGRIRANTRQGMFFYGPKVNNEDKAGKLHRCDCAYSLISMYMQDFLNVGGLTQNVKWGGDSDDQSVGGEDVVMGRRLRNAGLTEIRPFERDLIDRWHVRDVSNVFYSTLGGYKKKPWWTFVND